MELDEIECMAVKPVIDRLAIARETLRAAEEGLKARLVELDEQRNQLLISLDSHRERVAGLEAKAGSLAIVIAKRKGEKVEAAQEALKALMKAEAERLCRVSGLPTGHA